MKIGWLRDTAEIGHSRSTEIRYQLRVSSTNVRYDNRNC